MTLLSPSPHDLESIRTRLQVLERDVASVSVPLAYAGEQYHLRLHIRLLQERLEGLRSRPPAGDVAPGDAPARGR